MAPHSPTQKISVDRMAALAPTVGCHASADVLEKLAAFAELIQRWNRRKRIVGRATAEELVGVHLADAMALAGQLQQHRTGSTLLDVGSGAGLPGFAVALLVPDLQVTLCEVSEKRVSFLHHARRTLEATVQIVHEDVHRLIEQDLRFDHVVSRAVFEPRRWLQIGRQCVADQGQLWFMLTHRQWSSELLGGETYSYEVLGQRQRVLLRLEGPSFT